MCISDRLVAVSNQSSHVLHVLIHVKWYVSAHCSMATRARASSWICACAMCILSDIPLTHARWTRCLCWYLCSYSSYGDTASFTRLKVDQNTTITLPISQAVGTTRTVLARAPVGPTGMKPGLLKRFSTLTTRRGGSGIGRLWWVLAEEKPEALGLNFTGEVATGIFLLFQVC